MVFVHCNRCFCHLGVSSEVGYIKDKSAIAISRHFMKRQRNFNGESFWARRYAVSTVRFEKKIQNYIKNQEHLDGFELDQTGEF